MTDRYNDNDNDIVKRQRARPNARACATKHGASASDLIACRGYLGALAATLDSLGMENPFPPSALPRPKARAGEQSAARKAEEARSLAERETAS